METLMDFLARSILEFRRSFRARDDTRFEHKRYQHIAAGWPAP